MLKALSFLLLLGALTGVSWVAFSLYRVKHEHRLIPYDAIMERAENFLNTSPNAGRARIFFDQKFGRCIFTTLPQPGIVDKSEPIPDSRFAFSSTVTLQDTGTLCEFPGHGKETMFSARETAAVFILQRRWASPPLLYLKDGGIEVSSNELDLEWAAPGMRVSLKSEGRADASIKVSATQPFVLLRAGKFSISLLRLDPKNGSPLPIRIGTIESATLSSDGKPLLKTGESIFLLPSGFTEISAAPNPGNTP